MSYRTRWNRTRVAKPPCSGQYLTASWDGTVVVAYYDREKNDWTIVGGWLGRPVRLRQPARWMSVPEIDDEPIGDE